MPPRATQALATALALVTLAASAPAGAQSFERTYRRLVGEAVDEFDTGNWAEARALFVRAHELNPNARTLRGIGMCAFEMREYEDAISLLEQSLASEERPLTPRLREETESLLVRARSFIGHFQVRLEPASARLLIDGAPPAPDERGQIVLPLGEHTFEASAPGYQPEERHIRVRGGESLEVSLSLLPLPEPAPEPPLPEPALGLLLGAGGAILFDAFTIGWLVEREGELSVCRAPPMGFSCGNLQAITDQRDAALASLVTATLVGVGLAAAGLLWWLLVDDTGEPSAWRCGPLGCFGHF